MTFTSVDKLKTPKKLNQTAFLSAVANCIDKLMAQRLKPPFWGCQRLGELFRVIYTSDTSYDLAVTDEDLRYYRLHLPEVYLFVTLMRLQRCNVEDLEPFRKDIKLTLQSLFRDIDQCAGNDFIGAHLKYLEYMSHLKYLEYMFRNMFQMSRIDAKYIKFLVELAVEGINEGFASSLVFIHGLVKALTNGVYKGDLLSFPEQLVIENVTTQQSPSSVLWVSEIFDTAYVSSVLASLLILISIAERYPNNDELKKYIGEVATAWFNYLCTRDDALEHLCDAFTMKSFFKNHKIVDEREIMQSIHRSASAYFGPEDSRSKVVKRHMNYMKLKYCA